jgi:hypothetical protein
MRYHIQSGDQSCFGDSSTPTYLDTVGNLLVLGVGSVPSVGHVPLVETKGTTWLQALVNLSVNTLEGRSVTSSLNSVD